MCRRRRVVARTEANISTRPQLAHPLPEVNIAVVGAEGVGKSTFIQKALELPDLPPSQSAERKIPIDGSVYLVRLLELPIDNIEVNDDETINWPDTIDDKMMPRVDGALALYDVKDKASIGDLPDMLGEWTHYHCTAIYEWIILCDRRNVVVMSKLTLCPWQMRSRKLHYPQS